MFTSSNRRNYSEAVLKKLFALSRNACAFPRCEEPLSKPEWPKVNAEICHIAGLNPNSARYDPAMSNADRNDWPNLLLLRPNHHHLIDVLEPERFDVATLYDMKYANETHRAGDQKWCTDELAEAFVKKLEATLNLTLVAPGEEPRLIRSGDPMPAPAPRIRDRSGVVEINHDWPRGPRKVKELASELGITVRELLELSESLGISARSKDTRLPEHYADMVRRRVRRGGWERPVTE